MKERLRILLVDDDEDDYFLLKEMISGRAKTLHRYELDRVATYEEAKAAFLQCQYDLYLVDYQLGSRYRFVQADQ